MIFMVTDHARERWDERFACGKLPESIEDGLARAELASGNLRRRCKDDDRSPKRCTYWWDQQTMMVFVTKRQGSTQRWVVKTCWKLSA